MPELESKQVEPEGRTDREVEGTETEQQRKQRNEHVKNKEAWMKLEVRKSNRSLAMHSLKGLKQ